MLLLRPLPLPLPLLLPLLLPLPLPLPLPNFVQLIFYHHMLRTNVIARRAVRFTLWTCGITERLRGATTRP
jgi:hypothetical protein